MILNYDQIGQEVGSSISDLSIDPFVDGQEEDNVISYGLGSFGYDIRVGDTFEVFTDIGSSPVDPKEFDEGSLVEKRVEDYIKIPPNSFALGHAVEHIVMPDDLMGICLGKSTYARCGIIVNMTPIEPGWEGHLTIEISNTTPLPAKVYANEGIAQILFFRGEEPSMTYGDKSGKYQGQKEEIYHATVA